MGTWLEYIQQFIPDVTKEQADYILWEKTAFPMGGKETIEKQIQEYARSES